MRILTSFFLVILSVSASADVVRRTLNNGNLILEDIPVIPESLVTQLNRYQNVRSALVRDFTLDGESIFISTRFGNVSQIHRVDEPGGARRQITFFKEPMGSVSRRPSSETIAFTMDAGGSEFSQIFMLDTRSGESNMLTDGESRNGAMLWNHSGSQIAYQSTARNGRSNDVWVMNPDEPESARVVLQSPDGSWWGPVAWDAADERLLVMQYVAITDARIHLLDLKTGERQQLVGGAATPSYNEPHAFSPNGKGMFFSTDQFGEFSQLAYLDFMSGDIRVLTEDIPGHRRLLALAYRRSGGVFSQR